MSEEIKCRLEEKKKKSLDFSPWGPASNFRITWGQGLESGFSYPRTSTASQNAECVSTFLGLLFFYYSLTERLVPECRRTWKRGWAPCTGKSRGSKSGPLLSLSVSWAGLPLHFLGGSLPVIFLPQSQTPAGISATSQPQGSACRAVCSEKRPGLGTRVPEPRQACKVSRSWLRLFGVGLRGCLFDPFFCSQGRGLSLAVCFLSSACLATPGEESREDTPTVVWDSHPLGLAGANVVSECHCFMRSLSPSVKGTLFLDVPWVSDSCSVMPDFLQPHGL